MVGYSDDFTPLISELTVEQRRSSMSMMRRLSGGMTMIADSSSLTLKKAKVTILIKNVIPTNCTLVDRRNG